MGFSDVLETPPRGKQALRPVREWSEYSGIWSSSSLLDTFLCAL